MFCIILDRISSFIHVNEKVCNKKKKKKLIFGLAQCSVIEFPNFTACRICKEVVVLNEMHWRKVGSAGKKKVGYCVRRQCSCVFKVHRRRTPPNMYHAHLVLTAHLIRLMTPYPYK